MTTHQRRNNVLEREFDSADQAARDLLVERHIIDTTAVVLYQETTPAQVSMTPQITRMMDHVRGEIAQPSHWRRRQIWLAATIIIGVFVIVIGSSLTPTVPSRIFTIATAKVGNLTHTVTAQGTISADVVGLHFATGGQIAAIDVQPGQHVQVGQVVAQLNPAALQAAVTAQQASVTAAQASYHSALVALQNAHSEQQSSDATAQDAYDAVVSAKPAPSAAQLQLARDQLKLATIQAQNLVNSVQTQVTVAQAQTALAQTQLATAQHALTHATLTTPISGQVGTVSGNVGATVTSADAILTIADLTTTRITAFVNEADIGTVNVGWPVAFTVAAFPQNTFYGTITAISLFEQNNQGIVSYPVTINIAADSDKVRLFSGMTAHITMTTQEAIGTILVPNATLTYAQAATREQLIANTAVQGALASAQNLLASAPDLSGGTPGFILQYRQGKLSAIPVITGISDGTETVILAGLQENESIVIGDNHTSASTMPATG